jgi:hypothetical protein
MLLTARRWRPWSLDTETYTLHKITHEEIADYPVDLERCLNSADVLDWILQIDGGENDQVTLGFVRAIDDLLAPQRHLCSFGKSTTLSVRKMHDLVDAYVTRAHVAGS